MVQARSEASQQRTEYEEENTLVRVRVGGWRVRLFAETCLPDADARWCLVWRDHRPVHERAEGNLEGVGDALPRSCMIVVLSYRVWLCRRLQVCGG